MVSESPILVFQCLTGGVSFLLSVNNGRRVALLVKDHLTGVNTRHLTGANTQVRLLDRVVLNIWSGENGLIIAGFYQGELWSWVVSEIVVSSLRV